MKKAIGIIGGMGPLATVDLFKKCVEECEAHSDQEHLHIYIDCNTSIPDRTQAILHGGPNPLPELVRSAVKLESMGAELLIMPCNTAHYFYDDLCAYVKIPILNMLQEAAKEVARRGYQKVGLLATSGVIQSGIYENMLRRHGIEAVKPAAAQQETVMELIYRYVKAGDQSWDPSPFYEVLDDLKERGAQTFILGCTELPLAFQQLSIDAPAVDPTLVLAHAAIVAAGGKLKDKN